MGNFNSVVSQSGFTTMPEAKYYNKYTGTTGIKGDATNADGTAGFYGDFQYFVNSSNPWFYRGGHYYNGSTAGIFFFSGDGGDARSSRASRLSISTW